MTDDDHHHEPDQSGTVHLHVLGADDDLQRVRVILTAAHLAMYDDYPCQLARDLVLDCLFQLTVLCKIEIRAGDRW